MNTLDLSSMHDIIVPQFHATMWPLAWGYWLLIVSGILLCIGSIWWLRRHRRIYQAMYAALRELKATESIDAKQASVLLKRVAIHYHGRSAVASLAGETWVTQLKQWTPRNLQPQLEHFFAQRYQLQTDATAAASSTQDTKKMLKQIIRRCSRHKGTLHAVI